MQKHTPEAGAPWAERAADVLSKLEVSPQTGLTAAEVRRRRKQYGPNQMQEQQTQQAWQVFANQFKSVIVLILLGAAAASFVWGQMIDGAVISVAVLVNTLIGFVMEMRAIRSMESLRRMEQVTAKVIRDRDVREIPAGQLVPGDIVTLEGGDIVSADLRLIEANKLRANESALTGESVPVGKHTEPVEPDADLPQRRNMLFKGTSVTAGSARGVVTRTGMNTELGRIAALVQAAEDEQTPLEQRLEALGRRLLWITLGILVAVALVGIARGKGLLLMVETAIALAVAAIPEGLPIVATVAMARGMVRMARHHALVSRLAAVETLGSTTVICTDKTGTLTANKMTVVRLRLADKDYDVADAGQDGSAFLHRGEPVEPESNPALVSLLRAGVLCNNASLGQNDSAGAVGDPVEVALLEAGAKAGMERQTLVKQYPEVREESFDPAVKMMATFNKDGDRYRVMVKGAPEAVIKAAVRVQVGSESQPLPDQEKQRWNERNIEMAEKGLRLLAVATRTTDSPDVEPYQSLTLLGLVGMDDPPREEVRGAIARCRQAGIRVVMVTGDHAATAQSVAQALELVDAPEDHGVTGTELGAVDELSERDRNRLVKASVFSRVSPEQKLNLIDVHQKAGAVVAMTGDGVNDAPALKKADIGVAMGQRGTQVAREAADMVLNDDAFSSIVVAVEEGRIIFGNIRKFALYLLSGNASEILVVFIASLLNWPLPILPLQILFLNIVNDVFPALALGLGQGSADIMTKPPRAPAESVLRSQEWSAVFAYGGLIAVAVLAAYWLSAGILKVSHSEAVTASFLTLAFARLWHIFNLRDAGDQLFTNEITQNHFVWAALLLCMCILVAAIYLPVLPRVLSLTSPDRATWALIVALSLGPLVVGQTVKAVKTPQPVDGS